MHASIEVTCSVHESPRVEQVRGLFDLTPEKTSSKRWNVALPIDNAPWAIGLICGPSGCGKSTVAKHLWPALVYDLSHKAPNWLSDQAIVDAFPENMSIKDITEVLSAVGFSSPPAWLQPFHTLSTGQQFRATMARLLCVHIVHPMQHPLVVDEFTSVVDRTVAQVGSAAIARTVRARSLKFVAVTCHEDIIDWLQPDWIYRPATDEFVRRSVQPRPRVELSVQRCHHSFWRLFAPHHYLSADHNPSAVCFLARWRDRPVAFSSWLPFVGRTSMPTRREHRTVCLPDYQGVGIGNAVSALIASMWKGLGMRATSTTTHPGMIASRLRSRLWEMTRQPSLGKAYDQRITHATTRFTAGFSYIGPAMNVRYAKALLNG